MSSLDLFIQFIDCAYHNYPPTDQPYRRPPTIQILLSWSYLAFLFGSDLFLHRILICDNCRAGRSLPLRLALLERTRHHSPGLVLRQFSRSPTQTNNQIPTPWLSQTSKTELQRYDATSQLPIRIHPSTQHPHRPSPEHSCTDLRHSSNPY